MHSSVEIQLQTASSRTSLEAMMRPAGSDDQGQERRGQKRPIEVSDDEDDDQAHDEVRLWEDGFKDRYYESKFDVAAKDLEFR